MKLNLKENQHMKLQYCEQLEEIQVKYKNLQARHNDIQKEVVAIEEIKRDRDERIARLRAELDELSQRHDEQTKNFASMRVRHKTL